jgi:hypothetical protein
MGIGSIFIATFSFVRPIIFIDLNYQFFVNRSIMSAPVTKFKTVEKVDRIYRILSVESHHGFPVVDHHSDEVCTFFLYPSYS